MRHRFLSPHYDDIALSCGGTAALLARAARAPEIAILFGAEPDSSESLTPFATMQHERWGVEASDVIAARRLEEATAAAILGATVTYLPFHDAIYRGDAYLDDDQLIGEPVATEAALPARIIAALDLGPTPTTATRLYAPLAIGGHVDHRHAFAAGLELAHTGWDVWFYEDLPYALSPGSAEARIANAAAPLRPAALVDVEATWNAKLRAIYAYPSQLGVIFRGAGGSEPANVDRRLRAYATGIGDGRAVERFWRLAAADPGVKKIPLKLPAKGY
jgi:LmbE family N-acetylglucosaminyl deacetylase